MNLGAESPLHRLLGAAFALRKGRCELPAFFDALNDALEAHDAEEYSRVVGAMRALLARHEKEEAELYPLPRAR